MGFAEALDFFRQNLGFRTGEPMDAERETVVALVEFASAQADNRRIAGPLTPAWVTSSGPRCLREVPGTETSTFSTETPGSSRSHGESM